MDEYNSFTGLWTWSPTETVVYGNPNCSAAKTGEGQNAAQDQSVPAYKDLFQETKCALGLMFHFFLGLLSLL